MQNNNQPPRPNRGDEFRAPAAAFDQFDPRQEREQPPSAAQSAVSARKGKKTAEGLSFDQFLSAAIALALLFAGIYFWWRGAIFTLIGLALLGMPFNPELPIADLGVSLLQWLVPVMVSVVIWKYWPFSHSRIQWIGWKKRTERFDWCFWLWLSALLIDVGSNIGGILVWSKARVVIANTDIVLPTGGTQMWLMAVTLAIVLAIIPLKLFVAALDLWHDKFGAVPVIGSFLGYPPR